MPLASPRAGVGGGRDSLGLCGEMLGLGETREVALWLVGGRVKIR